jgi:hypothetical protein
MDDHSIHGPLDTLERLATLVELSVAGLKPGERTLLRDEFAPGTAYSLVRNLRPDGFDPASADGALN